MRDFELVYIVDPTIADENVPAVTERITRWINTHGGEVSDVNPWGRRRLAYPIKEKREGNYVAVQFRITANRTPELERTLKLSEDIVRHMLLRQGD